MEHTNINHLDSFHISTPDDRRQLRTLKQSVIKPGEKEPKIWGMSYNSASKELYLADSMNYIVRAIRVGEQSCDLRDVYRGHVLSVCHMSHLDTLLVCLSEQNKNWLVALSCSEFDSCNERVQTEGPGYISCALSDSRVLIGQHDSKYMELFHVDSYRHVERASRVAIPEQYTWFSAMTRDSGTFVAMSYRCNNEVRVHRLDGDRLEELTRATLQRPNRLLWLADRLLVTEFPSDNEYTSVTELKVCGGERLEFFRQLISPDKQIFVKSWCIVDDGIAIFEWHSRSIQHYRF